MDDLDLLLVIVGLFYLYGCAYWVRPGSLVFVSFLGGRHHPHTIGHRALLRNDHGGLLLGNVLPLGSSVQTQVWPISLSPDGVFGWVAQAITPEGRPDQSERFYHYDDIQTVTVNGSEVRINNAPFVKVCSAALAHTLAACVEKLAALPPDRREAEIDQVLADAFDAPAADTRYRAARRQTVSLLLLCTLLLLYVFVFVPVSVAFAWKITFAQYIIIYVGLLGMVMVQFYGAHQDVLPEESATRRKHTLMMLIAPANAMHARNELFRDVLSRYHPLAVARDRCTPEEFQHFARHILLDLRHPLAPVCPSQDPAACETERWFRAKLTRAVLRLVRGANLDPDQIAAPPEQETAECLSHCPRCSGQFTLESGFCHCCAEMPLRRFDAPLPEPFPAPEPVVETTPPAKEPEPPPVAMPPTPQPAVPAVVAVGKKGKRRKGQRKRS